MATCIGAQTIVFTIRRANRSTVDSVVAGELATLTRFATHITVKDS
jgi:hypothetical protein